MARMNADRSAYQQFAGGVDESLQTRVVN